MNEAAAPLPARGEDRFIHASDGLRLHVVDYAPPVARGLPVVCLPGLARTARDFEALAAALSHQRRVIAVDYRGRGRSDYDPDPTKYNVMVELTDLETALDALGIERAVFVGTSRGGILTMLLASARPQRMGGIVLNDIGPVIEPAGLVRIKSYVGKLPRPRDLDEGADILERLFADQFPNLSSADWSAAADLTWRMESGTLFVNYDEQLARTLDGIAIDNPLPTLWEQFAAIPPVPVMVIRGALSDILSAETVEAMRAKRPDLESILVADEGHPPLLRSQLAQRVAAFVARCDHASPT